jgi:hypothetical protein
MQSISPRNEHSMRSCTQEGDRLQKHDRAHHNCDQAHSCTSEQYGGGLILEIGLRFVLRFLGFLGASRVLLNSINWLINTKLYTLDF